MSIEQDGQAAGPVGHVGEEKNILFLLGIDLGYSDSQFVLYTKYYQGRQEDEVDVVFSMYGGF